MKATLLFKRDQGNKIPFPTKLGSEQATSFPFDPGVLITPSSGNWNDRSDFHAIMDSAVVTLVQGDQEVCYVKRTLAP